MGVLLTGVDREVGLCLQRAIVGFVVDGMSVGTHCMFDARFAAATRSTSPTSRQSIHHLASVIRRHALQSAWLFELVSAASRLFLIVDAQLICRSVPVSSGRTRCETAALLNAAAATSSARFSATKQSRQIVVFSHLALRSCWLSKPVR